MVQEQEKKAAPFKPGDKVMLASGGAWMTFVGYFVGKAVCLCMSDDGILREYMVPPAVLIAAKRRHDPERNVG